MNNVNMAEKLVRENVIINVGPLVAAIYSLFTNANCVTRKHVGIEEGELMALWERIDYEAAGHEAINANADLGEMVDSVGLRRDAALAAGYHVDTTEEGDFFGFGLFNRAERDAVGAFITAEVSDWKSFCNKFDVDTDDFRLEVCEHWAVTDWLGRRLAAKGECVSELLGTTVWGRCTSGQAISMDGVIASITKDVN